MADGKIDSTYEMAHFEKGPQSSDWMQRHLISSGRSSNPLTDVTRSSILLLTVFT